MPQKEDLKFFSSKFMDKNVKAYQNNQYDLDTNIKLSTREYISPSYPYSVRDFFLD